jgi:hypothetical protein
MSSPYLVKVGCDLPVEGRSGALEIAVARTCALPASDQPPTLIRQRDLVARTDRTLD